MVNIKSDISVGVLIFFLVFLVYVTSPIMMSFDSRWSIHTGLSILNEGNTNLDEYEKEIIADENRAMETINGHYYTTNPVGATVLSLPLIALADMVFNFAIDQFPSLTTMIKTKLASYNVDVDKPRLVDIYPGVEMIIASFYCALAAVMMFFVSRLFLEKKHAFIIVLYLHFVPPVGQLLAVHCGSMVLQFLCLLLRFIFY